MTSPFAGTPHQQWLEVMDRRYKAGIERQLVTDQTGRTSYEPPVHTMQDQERYEDPEVFCRYCGFDPCECERYIDTQDYSR